LFFMGLLMGGQALMRRVANLKERVRQEHNGEETPLTLRDKVHFVEAVFKPLGTWVPRSAEEMSKVEQKLTQAGIRRKDGPVLFYGSQVALALSLLFVFAATGPLYKHFLLCLAFSILVGMAFPELWLRRRISARKERIQCALPDAMDLAVITVEAGLGLDQSLQRIGEEIHIAHPDLSDEFQLRNLEVNMGKTRVEAFRNLAARTGVEDVKALVAILIQTDRFGTSIAQSLRVFAESMRVKRRQRAEERAAKMALKMIPPMVFFIFPSMFVTLLGPAIISVIRELVPALTGQ
jgi:tight adherence protein C